jgi:hypothetical protein
VIKQTKKASIIETVLNTAIGYGVALTSQLVVFPMVGIYVAFSTNILIGAIFTIISIVRGFFVRRLFEHLRVTGFLP